MPDAIAGLLFILFILSVPGMFAYTIWSAVREEKAEKKVVAEQKRVLNYTLQAMIENDHLYSILVTTVSGYEYCPEIAPQGEVVTRFVGTKTAWYKAEIEFSSSRKRAFLLAKEWGRKGVMDGSTFIPAHQIVSCKVMESKAL